MRGQHKGENGKVLIIGGSERYVGAAALAGLAALRSGCDIVKICAPEMVAYTINAMSPDIITIKLRPDPFIGVDNINEILEESVDVDCVLIGNGIGTKKETNVSINKIVEKINKPIVVDADGIKVLAGKKLERCVITPHAREFEIFFNEKADENAVMKHAREDFIILLKGKTDIISDGKTIRKNTTGNDAMTVGGTGDVLAGLVAGFIAQKHSLYHAAYMGAYVNGMAGDMAFKEKGYSLLASDILEYIPYAMKHFNMKYA